MDEVLFARLAQWLRREAVVLAEVTETVGNTPRKRGSRMLVTREHAAFSIGGGLAEARVIDAAAVGRYERAVAEACSTGAVLAGGERCLDETRARGHYVRPTVVTVPPDSWLWSTELFVPFIAVQPVDDLDAAIAAANDSPLGLTAGFFSSAPAEVDGFLDRIQAGVVYVNRRAGATTGAWPGVQPFGGWKGSGTTGKAGGGPYYLLQYLREQSRTVITE